METFQLATSEDIDNAKESREIEYENENLLFYKKTDEIQLFRYIDNKREGIIFQTYISEKYIANAENNFSENGKAALFVVPCQSLMGDKMSHVSESGKVRGIDDSMAQAFFGRGAGLYVGYDESSSSLAQFGGMRFIANLLSGLSFETALSVLPAADDDTMLYAAQNWRTDPDPNATYVFEHLVDRNDDGTIDRQWDVARHHLTGNGFKMDSYVVSPMIFPTVTASGDSYEFKGLSNYCPRVELNYNDRDVAIDFYTPDESCYGFCISRVNNPASGAYYPASMVSRDPDSHRVSFELTIPSYKLESNTEYHVWPCIARKSEYNYGEPIVFTTGAAIPNPSAGDSIDMGLSVKWASFNLGATKPDEYGYYYAWGEVGDEGQKDTYSWSTYKWGQGEYGDEMTKYCTSSSFGYNGFVDNKTVLDAEDDAAHREWGGTWRMPTKAEFEELVNPDNCSVQWDPDGGVPGLRITSKKTGKQIFLPAAGSKSANSTGVSSDFGRYWSSSLNTESPCNAHYLYFNAEKSTLYNYYRYYGYPVRPVCTE